jgi:transcriptional regulator with XRE-family HTH domain
MGGTPNIKLKAWRVSRGLTLEEAATKVVVDGRPCTKATWHGWETGQVPKPPFMLAVCDLTGLEPNDFYPRPDGGARPRSRSSDGTNGSGGGTMPQAGNGNPPQMALAL